MENVDTKPGAVEPASTGYSAQVDNKMMFVFRCNHCRENCIGMIHDPIWVKKHYCSKTCYEA